MSILTLRPVSRLTRLVPLVAAAFGLVTAAQAQPAEVSGSLLGSLRRGEHLVSFEAKGGKAQSKRVTVDQWTLVAGRDVQRIPAQGDVVFQLRAGRIRTLIDGQKLDRREGDIWLLPTGTSMAVSVMTEMATLQSVSLLP